MKKIKIIYFKKSLLIICMFFLFSKLFMDNAYANIEFVRISKILMRDEITYPKNSIVPISIKIAALGSKGDPYFVVLEIKESTTKNWFQTSPQKFSIWKSTDLSGGLVNYKIPINASAGYYDLRILVFSGFEKQDGSVVLLNQFDSKEISSAFYVTDEIKFQLEQQPHNDKLVLYESREDGLYIDGKKATQEEIEMIFKKNLFNFYKIELNDHLTSNEISSISVISDRQIENSLEIYYFLIFLICIILFLFLIQKRFIRRDPVLRLT